MRNSLSYLSVILVRTINNPNTTVKNRDTAKEALDAVRETKRKFDDERTNEEATNSLWRTFGFTKHFRNNEKEI